MKHLNEFEHEFADITIFYVLAMFQNNITAALGMYLLVSCGIDVTSLLLFLCLFNTPVECNTGWARD